MRIFGQVDTDRKRVSGYRLAVVLICMAGLAQSVFARDENIDVKGSKDPGFLQRFPYSTIISYEKSDEVVSHELVYGSLRKINNVLRPEQSLMTEGKLTRMNYSVPDGIRSSEVIAHYYSQIIGKGDILFYCQRRDCGSSNYWANNIFGKGILYGPEEYQNLIVARIPLGDRTVFVSVYAIQRGNQSGYVYLELVEISENDAQSSSSLLEKLQSDGYLTLDDLIFDKGMTALTMTPQLKSVISLMQAHQELGIHIVGHSGRGTNLDTSINESTRRAELVKARLVAEGIAAGRLSAHGIGTLALDSKGAANRIVLLLDED